MFTCNEKKNFMKATRNVHALYYRTASTYVFFMMAIKLFDEVSSILIKKTSNGNKYTYLFKNIDEFYYLYTYG